MIQISVTQTFRQVLAVAGGHDSGATIVLRVDGTISIAHSGKQQAAGTFKGTFGFHPLGCWIDNTPGAGRVDAAAG